MSGKIKNKNIQNIQNEISFGDGQNIKNKNEMI